MSNGHDPHGYDRSHSQTNRRDVLRTLGGSAAAIGAVAIGTSPVGAQEHTQNRGGPTLTVSSPECEQLTLSRDERGPTTEVTVSGPTSFMAELGRGEGLTRAVDAGTYTVSTSPRAVVTVPADGEIEVEQCYPPSVSARLDCDRDPSFRIYNRLERDIYVKMVTYFNSGVTRYEGDIIEPSRWEWYPTPRPDGWVEKYEYTVYLSSDEEQIVPMSGYPGTFVADAPCEELNPPWN